MLSHLYNDIRSNICSGSNLLFIFSTVEGSFVETTSSHLYHGDNVTLENITCSYWNTTIEYWDTKGCELVSSTDDSVTTCRCNHLTNLAVIMDINGVLANNKVSRSYHT